jgi:hypothetical protein
MNDNATSASARPSSDELIRLIDISVQKRDRTRDIQWKTNVALWTLLAAAIFAGISPKDVSRIPRPIIAFMAVFPVMHFAWAVLTHVSLVNDGRRIDEWTALVTHSAARPRSAWSHFWFAAIWVAIQVSVTAVLTAAAIWACWFRQ